MLEFEIDYKITGQDSFNRFWSGVHHTKRTEFKNKWRMLTKVALSKTPKRTLKSPIMIEFWFHSRLDLDGHAPIQKEIIDSLVDGEWLVNDNKNHVVCIVSRFLNDNECVGKTVKVRVTEI